MEIQVLEGPIAPVVPQATEEETSPSDELPARDECDEPSEVEAAFSSTPNLDTEEDASNAEQLVDAPTPHPTPGPKPGATPSATPNPTPGSVPSATPNPDPQVPETPSEPAEAPKASESPAESDEAEQQNAAEDNSSADNATAHDATTESSEAPKPSAIPKPSMMAPRRKLRSRYVPLPEEVWSSSGFQTHLMSGNNTPAGGLKMPHQQINATRHMSSLAVDYRPRLIAHFYNLPARPCTNTRSAKPNG